MKQLANKNILLGITAGIAAYKSADLVRRLRDANAHVRVVMTSRAKAFITPLTFQALSGHNVFVDLFDAETEPGMDHIALARFADVLLVAPASADFMAKLAHGIADDLLTTLCLATKAPIAIAPAMNQQMWANAATRQNHDILMQRGIHILGPATGSQACGDVGPGRMLEVDELISMLAGLFSKDNALLKNIRVIITAGPTWEAIDPVRYITNHSSGKMGYALATAAQGFGAHVTLISGPVALPHPANIETISVTTTQQMYDALMQKINDCDILISAAAPADYHAQVISPHKIKKTDAPLTLRLVPNPDILLAIAALKKRPFTVGFAAESQSLEENAHKKLTQKKLDMIVANDISKPNGGFHSDNNEVIVLWPHGEQSFSMRPKIQLADELIELIAKHYKEKIQTRS